MYFGLSEWVIILGDVYGKNGFTCDLSGAKEMKSVSNIILLLALSLCFSQSPIGAQTECPPTAPDAEGPFYKPEAPLRDRTGRGLLLSGKVKSAGSCAVIPGARVEWWQANSQGGYDDKHRGAQLTSSDGTYRVETDFPPSYFFRPPHIHFKVFAPGHRTLTTQIYPKDGQRSITFDFVLEKK